MRAFVASIERDYEILEYDPSRKSSYRVKRMACELANEMCAPFEIEDASGRVRVLPEGAIIEGVAAVDRHESHAAERPIPEAPGADVTLARRFREMHLPIDSKIYVLGVVGEDGSISAPRKSAKGQRFLISVNTEEARTMEPAAGASGCSGSALPASSALSCRRLGRLAEQSEPGQSAAGSLQGGSVW